MKKFFLASALALFGALSAQTAGSFKLGGHIGIPTGDAGDVFGFNAGVDLAYVWRVAPNFDLGLTTGYSHYFVKSDYSDYIDGTGMIPIAATAQYNFGNGPFIGLDLGYAFFTQEGSDGGFLYQPKVGYTFQNVHDLYLSYKGISNDGTLSSINLGYAYRFGK
ncbi:MAG: outer membrane beta-barrel protein [Kaistella sp.]